jgi:predicted metal-binding membrane protein
MSLLQATPLAARVSDSVRSSSTRIVLACTATAWLALAVPWPGGSAAGAHAHHGHAMAPMSEVVDPLTWGWLSTWLLMVVAMMWPLAVPTVGAVARASFRGWGVRLAAACLATVTLLWLAFGVAGAVVARLFAVRPGSLGWQLVFVGVALLALGSVRRSRVLEKCLRLPPLAPGGRRGLVTAARAGLLTWRRCALLCGPMMLAMTVGHSVVLMGCASLAAWWEAWHPRAWHDRVPIALVAGGGLWLVLSPLVDSGLSHG